MSLGGWTLSAAAQSFPSATQAGQLLFPPEKLLAALREGNSRRKRSGDSAQEVETLPGAQVVLFALSMCMGPCSWFFLPSSSVI